MSTLNVVYVAMAKGSAFHLNISVDSLMKILNFRGIAPLRVFWGV